MSDLEFGREPGTTPQGRVGRFHFAGGKPVSARYRLIAVLDDGQRAMIRMGHSPAAVKESPLPMSEALRARVIELRVERWVGGWTDGAWELVPQRHERRPGRNNGRSAY